MFNIDTSKLPEEARIFIMTEREYGRFMMLEEPINNFHHTNTLAKYYNDSQYYDEPVLVRIRAINYKPYEVTTDSNITLAMVKDVYY